MRSDDAMKPRLTQIALIPSPLELAREKEQARQREELVLGLAECGGCVVKLARNLGLSSGAVHYRLRKFGLS